MNMGTCRSTRTYDNGLKTAGDNIAGRPHERLATERRDRCGLYTCQRRH